MPARSDSPTLTSRDRKGADSGATTEGQSAPLRSRLVPSTVGLIGARGHTGTELLNLISQHPHLSLAFASSRQLAGQNLPHNLKSKGGDGVFIDLSPADLTSHHADIFILALPNGASPDFVNAIDASERADHPLIIDLSADHRFDDDWTYGLPELNAAGIASSKRIANPGCYATSMMLALAPIAPLLDGPPHCFGVSGYSGAGSTPSPRNDVEQLRDNLMPYQLADHLHEREVSRQLGLDVNFMPHVASFFRGISMTVSARLREPATRDALIAQYQHFVTGQPFVHVEPDDIPLPRDAAGTHRCAIGGFTVSGRDARDIRIVSTLDNLLKGAASQAIQNINLARGWEITEGLTP